MAKVYLTEYADIRGFAGYEPASTTQVITTSGASQSFTAFLATTRFIRIHTDNIISFKVGVSPVTVALTDSRMALGQTEYFTVTPGHVLAVITNT